MVSGILKGRDGMATTIHDLAKHVGLSMSAVSKALNGYPDVSEATRKAVRQAALELNYTPNVHARALKSKRSYNLGMLFSDDSGSGLTHPFFSVVMENFKKEAEQEGFDITFISHRIGQSSLTYLDHCRSRELDGVCIANTDFRSEEIQMLINSELPLITVDNPFPGKSCVMADNGGGMSALAEHVIGFGHRRIAYIHGSAGRSTDDRIEALRRTAESRHIELPPEYLVPCEYVSPDSCYQATRRLLELPERPTCILACDDYSALGTYAAVQQAGLRIPQDISVAGYDGIKQMQRFSPRLTTVDQDAPAIGRIAAVMLIELIGGGKARICTVPSLLIEGETVAPAA